MRRFLLLARACLPVALALYLLPACFGEIGADDEAPGEVSDDPVTSDGPDASDGTSPQFSGDIPPAGTCPADQADPGPELTRRLTVHEYVRTVEDTLGVQVDASALPPDAKDDGFTNTASALTVTFSHVQAYFDLADRIVEAIPDFSAVVERHASCRDMRDPCQDSYIESMGSLLYRRPLERDEVERIRPIFAQVARDGGDFDEAAGHVLRRLLQSPQFLYRLEAAGPTSAGEHRQLSDHELAARLSYLVWGSAPDEALLVAARAGELRTGDGRAAEVARMLEHDRARDQLETYVRDWLYLDRLPRLERTRQRYPEFTAALAEDMLQETVRLADTLWLSQGAPMAALFSTQTTLATPALAEIYGLPSEGDGFERYDLSAADAPRTGALTHPGVLALSGLGETPSIVARGLYVLQNLLCGEIGDPPPGVDTTPVDSAPGRSQRYYSEQRLDNRSCAGCHGQFDPLAYALEPFDGIGRHRDKDEHGNALRSDGWFFALDGEMTPYDDTAEFLSVLAGSEAFHQCLVKKAVQYALGRPLLASDRCTLAHVWEAVEAGDGTYGETLIAIARHPVFARVRAEAP